MATFLPSLLVSQPNVSRSPIVVLEDVLAGELMLAELGVCAKPMVDGRYRIDAIRGRGARGIVCLAFDQRLEREVALKVYPPIDDPRLADELAREGRALARLDHPNVVRVHDAASGTLAVGGRELEISYLSMEFVEGRNLRGLLTDRALDREATLTLLEGVAAALDAAHARGLVHRDVKPENVMVDASGRARVVDFGLARAGGDRDARAPGSEDAAPYASSFGRLLGTLEYMAPEAREGRADARSDQYSFAVMAWECLTGTLPFAARDEPGPRAVPPASLPGAGALERPEDASALTRAMSFDERDRFESVGELMRALRPAPRAARLVPWFIVGGLGLLGVAVAVVTVPRGREADAGDRVALSDVVDAGTNPLPRDAGAIVAPPPVDAGSGAADAAGVLPGFECAQVAGAWDLRATTTDSRVRAIGIGHGSYFRLVLTVDDDCDAVAHLSKIGDDAQNGDAGPLYTDETMVRDDRSHMRLDPSEGAFRLRDTFFLSSHARGRRDYTFDLLLTPEAVSGTVEHTGRTGQRVFAGMVEGRRAPDAGVFAFDLARDAGPANAPELATAPDADAGGARESREPNGPPSGTFDRSSP